jgi:hypothetical protein
MSGLPGYPAGRTAGSRTFPSKVVAEVFINTWKFVDQFFSEGLIVRRKLSSTVSSNVAAFQMKVTFESVEFRTRLARIRSLTKSSCITTAVRKVFCHFQVVYLLDL